MRQRRLPIAAAFTTARSMPGAHSACETEHERPQKWPLCHHFSSMLGVQLTSSRGHMCANLHTSAVRYSRTTKQDATLLQNITHPLPC